MRQPLAYPTISTLDAFSEDDGMCRHGATTSGVTIIDGCNICLYFCDKGAAQSSRVSHEGVHRKVTHCAVLCSVPRSLDIKSNGKVASSSYAENVLGPAMAGQQQPTLLRQALPPH